MSRRLKESVYEVLSSSPTPLHLKDLLTRVKQNSPDLCDDSIRPCPYCKLNHAKWQHDVQWLLQDLKRRSLVVHTAKGYWQAKPRGPLTLVAEAVQTETKPPGRLHELLKTKIRDIGEAFGKIVHMEFPHPPYQYDVVWKDVEAFPPTHVFEVQDKGSLDGALSKLQHARDVWRSKLFLAIADEKDRAKLDMLLKPYWEGAFHKISKYTTVLTPEIIEQIHVVCRHKEIVKQLVTD